MKPKTLSGSAMLLDLHISTYTGRKQDKATAEEVNTAKNAKSKKASSVYKSLFADDADLEAIVAYGGRVRSWLYDVTLPWSDGGTRLVPTSKFFDISHELNQHEQEFFKLVQRFLNNYSTKVSAQAFKLGKLFSAVEYPSAGEIQNKFGFTFVFTPVPQAGDFRVDLPAEALAQVEANFEQAVSKRVQSVMQEPWDRLYKEVSHIKDKMIDKEGGKPQKLYQSMLDNALGLCETLKSLNIMNDSDLEAARRALELSLTNVDIKSLRQSSEVREAIKVKMQDLTDKFSLEI
jgi:hypothetical protein